MADQDKEQEHMIEEDAKALLVDKDDEECEKELEKV